MDIKQAAQILRSGDTESRIEARNFLYSKGFCGGQLDRMENGNEKPITPQIESNLKARVIGR